MPIIIRISIQDNDGIRSAINDEILAVLSRRPGLRHKEAYSDEGPGEAEAS